MGELYAPDRCALASASYVLPYKLYNLASLHFLGAFSMQMDREFEKEQTATLFVSRGAIFGEVALLGLPPTNST